MEVRRMLFLKFKKTIVTILVVLSFTIGASTSFAYTIWYEGGFRPTPTVVHPLSTFDSSSKTAMTNAAAQWNNAGAGTLVTIGSNTSNNTYPNKNSKNEVSKGYRGTNEYLMQANPTTTSWVWTGDSNTWYSHTLNEVDIDVNISYAWGNNGSSNLYDVGQVFTHELGHLLGLHHSNVSGATMWSGSAPGETYKRTIEADDKQGILHLY